MNSFTCRSTFSKWYCLVPFHYHVLSHFSLFIFNVCFILEY